MGQLFGSAQYRCMRPRLTSDAEIQAAYDSLHESGEKITIEVLRARIGGGVATARLTKFLREARDREKTQQELIPAGVTKFLNDAVHELVRITREQIAVERNAERTELIEGQKLLEIENLALQHRVEEGTATVDSLRTELHQSREELLTARGEMAKLVPVLHEHAATIAEYAKAQIDSNERTRQLEIDLAVTREKLSAAEPRRQD